MANCCEHKLSAPHSQPFGGLRKPLQPFARRGVIRVALLGILGGIGLAASSGLPAAQSSALDSAMAATRSTGGNGDFLDVDSAFRLNAVAQGSDAIRLEWAVAEGYYLYRSRIKVATDSPQAQLGPLTLPPGETKEDPYFGRQEVYHHDFAATQSVARSSSGTLQVSLKVTYQGCATAGLCYPPQTKSLNVTLKSAAGPAAASGADPAGTAADPAGTTASAARQPPASASGSSSGAGPTPGASVTATQGYVSQQSFLASILVNGSLLVVLGFYFAAGLLVSFTPCVLPMVPILSGIIAGQGEKVTVARGFSLAFTYVQGMALTYAAAGAAFALLFKQAPQAFFQQPWVIGLFVALFVVLAFSMFGVFTLQMPSAIQTRLTDASNRQRAGSYVGTFIMGAISSLVVTACVAPFLVGALTVISQTGLVARGAAALYMAGLGLGTPLLIVGASAGQLLPRVGPWMDTVKSIFGVVFLGVALYFAQQLIPDAVSMLLWSALAVIAGYWIFALKARDGGPAPAAVRAAGLLALVYGIILLIGLAAGGNDPLQPLSTLRASTGGAMAAREPALAFETIKSVSDLNRRVAAAAAAGRPVMLDFYADWCTSCKEMERYTFSDKGVREVLARAVLLHSDVTKNDDIDQALLKQFGIFGPPTIAFYGPDGTERRNYRVVGYMKAAEFAAVAREAFGADTGTAAAAVAGT